MNNKYIENILESIIIRLVFSDIITVVPCRYGLYSQVIYTNMI